MLHKALSSQLVALKTKGEPIMEFIRQSPVITGLIGGTVLGGGLIVAQRISRRRKPKAKRALARRRRARPRARLRGRRFQPRKHTVRRVHKHRRKGLDIIHRGKKRGISLKAIRASIASPKTPPQLKTGLRKLLRKKARR